MKDSIREHYSMLKPSEGFLQSVEERAGIAAASRHRRVQLRRVFAVAASFVLLGVFSFWAWSHAVRISVYSEVATHHLEEKRMDVETDDFLVLERSLPRFSSPVKSDLLEELGYSLSGGRYCSLNNRLAVQMRLVDSRSGKSDTLYVTHLKGELDVVAREDERVVGDVKVKMWREDSRLFVLASSIQ